MDSRAEREKYVKEGETTELNLLNVDLVSIYTISAIYRSLSKSSLRCKVHSIIDHGRFPGLARLCAVQTGHRGEVESCRGWKSALWTSLVSI